MVWRRYTVGIVPAVKHTQMPTQGFAAKLWAGLLGEVWSSLIGGAESSTQVEQPQNGPLRDAESPPPPEEQEEPPVQKELVQKINADAYPKTAIEPPSPLEADDFQLVARCGSAPPMATTASLRSGKDAPTPNWSATNRFGPLAALEEELGKGVGRGA